MNTLRAILYVILGILVGYILLALFGTPAILVGGVDSGIAALLGALIGAGTTAIVSIWQVRVQFRNERATSIYDAKRECYAESIALFADACVSLSHGQHYPGDFSREVQENYHRVMSNLLLYAGPEVNEGRLAFVRAYPDSTEEMPVMPNEITAKWEELKLIHIRTRNAMRSELGLIDG